MKLIPLNDKVLILPAPAESKTPGGIIIPGTAEGKPTRGTVVAAGPCANGKPVAGIDPFLSPDVLIKEGVEVMFPTYGGVEVDVDGTKHRLMPAEEILGVITEDCHLRVKNQGPPYSIGPTACGALAELVIHDLSCSEDKKTGEVIPHGPFWKDLSEHERREYKRVVIEYCLRPEGTEEVGDPSFLAALRNKIDEIYERTELEDLVLLNYTKYKHPVTEM